ncbi:MAG: flgK [Solirubrobacterales bacterium]|nr:flgK [Solirubrobacterales bacterium]
MSIASFSGLQTSLRALMAQQAALDTTAHNIANVNTKGYTRQTVELGASLPYSLSAGVTQSGAGAQIGQGVDVLAFSRARDVFGDLQYRAQQMLGGQASTQAQALDQAQDLAGEPSDTSINALLSNLHAAWQDVADQPQSTAAKAALIGHATSLAAAINQLDAGLAQIQSTAGAQYTALTGSQGPVQTAATEIATLNRSITDAVARGQQPNDLLDRRDLLLDQLSALGQVSVTDLGNGSIRLAFGDAATPLVDDTTVTWPQTLTTATGGKLGALLDLGSAGGTIGAYRADLDAMAAGLTAATNALQPTAFFSGTTAATLGVVATATTVTPGSTATAGANDLALQLAALRGGAADTTYAGLVRDMGAGAADAQRRADTSATLAASAEERRQSVGGVALDEELTDMLRFQRGYQAASRALSTMDEMLDVLINRTGRVGL